MIKLQKEGKGYSTLTSIRGVVKPAFQMAYNEEVVRRNPFDFKLTDGGGQRFAETLSLTEKQQKVWMTSSERTRATPSTTMICSAAGNRNACQRILRSDPAGSGFSKPQDPCGSSADPGERRQILRLRKPRQSVAAGLSDDGGRVPELAEPACKSQTAEK